jgi:hypothetical protein
MPPPLQALYVIPKGIGALRRCHLHFRFVSAATKSSHTDTDAQVIICENRRGFLRRKIGLNRHAPVVTATCSDCPYLSVCHDSAEDGVCGKAGIVTRAGDELAMGWMCYAGNHKDVSTSQM